MILILTIRHEVLVKKIYDTGTMDPLVHGSKKPPTDSASSEKKAKQKSRSMSFSKRARQELTKMFSRS